jgi:hypothetical protein
MKTNLPIKILTLITIGWCFSICACNGGTVDKSTSQNKSKSDSTKHNIPDSNGTSNESVSQSHQFGKWLDDGQGGKYREDFLLRNQLSGMQLVNYSNYSSGSSGGVNSTTKITLCANGKFNFYQQTHTSVYVEGASGSDVSEDEDEGTWRAVQSGSGDNYIMFVSEKLTQTAFAAVRIENNKISLLQENVWIRYYVLKSYCSTN